MVQSDREKLTLELGAVVQKLYSSASLEAGDQIELTDSYYAGKIHAYETVYRIIQQTSGLESSEFERKIDELGIAETLHLKGKPDGKYEIIYMEGRITTILPSASNSEEEQK